MVIWVIKTFLVQFFYVFLPCPLNPFYFCDSLPFLSFIVPIFAWNAPLLSPVWRDLLSFSFYCFPLSLHYSPKRAFLSLLAIFWRSAFSWVYLSLSLLPFACLLFSGICKVSPDNHFAFLHFFFFGMPPVLCINLHPLFFRHCLPDLIPWT